MFGYINLRGRPSLLAPADYAKLPGCFATGTDIFFWNEFTSDLLCIRYVHLSHTRYVVTFNDLQWVHAPGLQDVRQRVSLAHEAVLTLY